MNLVYDVSLALIACYSALLVGLNLAALWRSTPRLSRKVYLP